MIECRTIKELCSVVVDCPHSTPTWTVEGKIVVRSNNIKNGRIDFSSPSYTDDEHFQQRIKRATPQGGDIIITREAPMGEVGMIPEGIVCCLGQRMVLLRANPEICDNYYLLYSLQSRYVQHQISWSEGTGTTVSNLRIPHLEQLKIPYLPLSKQRQVSSVLRCLEGKIEQNRVINDNLQQQAELLYHERFETIDRDKLPVGWRIVRLGDVATISKKSFNPAKEPEMLLEHYSIPAFDEAHFPVFEPSTAIKSNKFIVDDSCFMISKLNPTTKRVWKPYCLTANAVCSTEFIVYKAKSQEITDFLYSVIDSTSFSDFMCSHVTGSTGSRQRTTPSDTLAFELILPNAEEIAEYQGVVSPMFEQIKCNAIENDRLKRLRDSLLPKLMSGEIDVSAVQL
jgi:type I restriction enzyme S subunit